MQHFTLSNKILPVFLVLSLLVVYKSSGQTIRYQNSVRGGFAIAANCLVNDPSHSGSEANGTAVNTAGGTTISSYSDLVLPAGSTISKAYLYVEGFATGLLSGTMKKMTSVKFKVPGGAYTTLTTASPGFIANTLDGGGQYGQFIIDVTSLMPPLGYISTVTAGGDPTTLGRYSVADLSPYVTGNYGYGWGLYVVYTNPASKYRNVTIADACNTASSNLTINNISVPSAGIVNAVVAITGCYGDEGLTDYASFGKSGSALTALKDPTTGATNDILNSTIGFCPQNNVSADGGPAINGNFTARNPYIYGAPNSALNWYSYYYDNDIINATGILPPSPTPISVNLTQQSGGGDVIGFGTYAVSVDISAAVLTKSIAPPTIIPGATATYTWTLDNTVVGGLNLLGIGFTDNLPAGIMIATPPAATIAGGTGGVITAVAGGTSVKLTGLTLNIGQTATMSVNITNVPGQLNPSCATNPLGFTNGFINIIGNTANLANGVSNQCLIVAPVLPVTLLNFAVHLAKKTVVLNWATASEKNNARFDIERSTDGINFSTIGSTPGSGNSTALKNYTFTDGAPAAGTNYYRLKQVDYDGKSENSNILTINIAKFLSNIGINRLQGNIAEITFDANQECILKTAVYDIASRKVMELPDQPLTEGPNTVNVDLSSLETGAYFVVLSNNNGMQEKIKIVK